jgi:hypothetical protein
MDADAWPNCTLRRADFLIGSFGKLCYTATNSAGTNEYLSGGGTRYGVGLGVGAQISLLPTIDIDVSGRYNFNSLLGKSAAEENLNTIGITANVLITIL